MPSPDVHPTALTVLHIGAEQTMVLCSHGHQAATPLRLPLGAQTTAQTYFQHTPPTPLELEHAIAAVEDALMRIHPLVNRHSRLVTSNAVIGDIARLAGATVLPNQSVHLTLDGMEQVFQRLSARSLGRHISQDVLPEGAGFAATLLILREFMHHMNFDAITVQR